MLMFKRSILVLALLAGGFVACSSSSNNSPDLAIIGSQGGMAGSTGAGGNGGNAGSGGSTAVGGAVAIDAGTALDSAIADGPVGNDAPIVVDSASSAAEAGSTTATKAGHLAIINATPGTGVIALDVTGLTPPTYDPTTGTCQ